MGCLSIIGGFTSLRLPETLHHKLPQTLEEGEEFGKNWQMHDCCRCPEKYVDILIYIYFFIIYIQALFLFHWYHIYIAHQGGGFYS